MHNIIVKARTSWHCLNPLVSWLHPVHWDFVIPERSVTIYILAITVTLQHCVPSARSSIAFRTPLSKALASAGLWKERPHLLSSTFQWWNVGVAMVYTRSFLSGQSRITCLPNRYPPVTTGTNFPSLILKWALLFIIVCVGVCACVLPVYPVAAHHGWGTGSCWRPAQVPTLAAGGGTPPPCSELPRPGPTSRHSSRPASSPPLSHARCSCHCRERKTEREEELLEW